jgi:hypothetical protein
MEDLNFIPDKVRFRDGIPEDVKIAIDSFFEATKMIKDGHVQTIPGEYVAKMVEVMLPYDEYKQTAIELMEMVNKMEKYDGL